MDTDRHDHHLDWAKTAPVPPLLGALIAWGAARHAARDLLVQDDERLTYADADTRSSELAARLLAHGIGRQSRVGILLPNGPEFVVTLFAVARIGAVAVPISTLSSPPELGRILRSCGCALLIATDRYLRTDFIERIGTALDLAAAVPPLASVQAPNLRAVWLWRGTAGWAHPVADRPAAPPALVAAADRLVTPADPACIIYTSGSTSDPKGVIHSHGTFMRSSRRWAASMPYLDGDRLFANSPMFWVGGLITSLLTLMQVGGALVGTTRSGGALLDVIAGERCTTLQVWPHLARAIAEDPGFADRDFGAMRAGSVLAMIDPANHPANGNQFGFAMGMTETAGPHSCAMPVVDDAHRGAMGLLAPGMQHRIVDPATGAILPDGEPGVLHVRGDTLMLGYVGREPADTFDADGWFDTGDICSIRDAHLFFHGRQGAMIKTSGANVAPAEVELVLYAVDGVAEAHVIGIPDEERGQLVGALIVRKAGRTLDVTDIVAQAKRSLSSYKVPRRVVIVDAAPATGTNKLDRRAAARLLEGAPSIA